MKTLWDWRYCHLHFTVRKLRHTGSEWLTHLTQTENSRAGRSTQTRGRRRLHTPACTGLLHPGASPLQLPVLLRMNSFLRAHLGSSLLLPSWLQCSTTVAFFSILFSCDKPCTFNLRVFGLLFPLPSYLSSWLGHSWLLPGLQIPRYECLLLTKTFMIRNWKKSTPLLS